MITVSLVLVFHGAALPRCAFDALAGPGVVGALAGAHQQVAWPPSLVSFVLAGEGAVFI